MGGNPMAATRLTSGLRKSARAWHVPGHGSGQKGTGTSILAGSDTGTLGLDVHLSGGNHVD